MKRFKSARYVERYTSRHDRRRSYLRVFTKHEEHRISQLHSTNAWKRGSGWQEALNEAKISMLSKDGREMLYHILQQGCQELGKQPPENLQ